MILLIAGFAVNKEAYGQNYSVDALRFSQYQFGSTARLKSLGNAQTAVGGDLSSLGGNPAGLGLFTRSEFSLTTEIMQYASESNYFSQSTNASRGRFDLNNLGAVFVVPMSKSSGQDPSSGLISFNFGLGYNKTNDFGNKIRFTGINPQNSIANFYAEIANSYSGTLDEGSLEDAAAQAQLIGLPSNSSNYISATNSANRLQDEVLIRNGSQSEFNLAAGLNIGNKFYLGTSVGFLGINYTSDNTFTEEGSISYPDATENYNTNYYQQFKSKGQGFNIKLGAIFRPNQYTRLGATAQSPNWYTIDETYTESNNTRLTDNPDFEDMNVRSQNQSSDFTYGLKTPAKFSLGAALFESKIGFITGDVEFVDYSSMELTSNDNADDFVEDNRFIVNNYKNALNYKAGVEIKALSPLLLRGGYSFTESPIENSDMDLNVNTYSFGGGYRRGNISIDIAYLTSSINSQVSPYKLDNGINPVATSKSSRNGIFITIGTRF